jgi:type I restriction enzyme, S subunit
MKQGWEIKYFEECIDQAPRTTKIPKKQFLTTGEYPIISQEDNYINGYWDKSEDVFQVERPLVIFGDHTKKLKYIDFDFVVGADGVKVLLPKKTLNARFFYYQLQYISLDDLGYARHYRLLKQEKIVIPPSEEQKQIVDKLDQAFAAIDTAKLNVKKNLENAKELFQSKLNEIFSQKGEGWVEQKLGDVCSLIKRGIAPKYIENGGIQVINQKCIRHHKIDLSLARRHNIDEKSVNKEKFIQLGDVLVNSTGVGTLGRVAQVRDVIKDKITVDTHVTIVRPKPDLFFMDFFGYALIKIESEISKSGEGASGQTELGRSKLQNNFAISYPTSHKEQERIAKLLDSIEQLVIPLKSNYQRELESLEELKESTLDKLFEGGL